MSEPRTTDYCARCSESPESGTHLIVGAPNYHEYAPPRPRPDHADSTWVGPMVYDPPRPVDHGQANMCAAGLVAHHWSHLSTRELVNLGRAYLALLEREQQRRDLESTGELLPSPVDPKDFR